MADLWDSSCVWESPLKTSRWAPGSELETPHLIYSDISPGENCGTTSKFWWWLNLYSAYVWVWALVSNTIFHSFLSDNLRLQKAFYVSFVCVCISSSQQTVNPPACLFNIQPKWSIAKHWSMKSKPLIYPCFKTTVIFFSLFHFLLPLSIARHSQDRVEREVESPLAFLEGQIESKSWKEAERQGSKVSNSEKTERNNRDVIWAGLGLSPKKGIGKKHIANCKIQHENSG